jgi:hypothetical protein
MTKRLLNGRLSYLPETMKRIPPDGPCIFPSDASIVGMRPGLGPVQVLPPSTVAYTRRRGSPRLSKNVAYPFIGVWNDNQGPLPILRSSIVSVDHDRPPSWVAAIVIGRLSDARYAVSASTSACAADAVQPAGRASIQVCPPSSVR